MPTIQTISQLTEATAAQITRRNANNGTRSALIAELKHMLPFLDKDETELRVLTEGTVEKLQRIKRIRSLRDGVVPGL